MQVDLVFQQIKISFENRGFLAISKQSLYNRSISKEAKVRPVSELFVHQPSRACITGAPPKKPKSDPCLNYLFIKQAELV
ncbi:hypothetical protein RRG08_013481 [Elysia crispata]|uniref:Uncharacterized protein n=1 Tax=Elysia crispata TaxID=231223 RepID=A0AAE0ZX34_9GAST|nr:hypothetical protein RRG08_013481 [Elysia crispata]